MSSPGHYSAHTLQGLLRTTLALSLSTIVLGCAHSKAAPNVVVVSDVTATETARGLHAGVWYACKQLGYTRYWNAPTQGDDSERQIDLIERHLHEATAGLVLLPDSPTTSLTEVVSARDAGVPVVIVHDALAVDPGPGVYNVLNDQTATARLGVERMYRNRPDDMPVAITGASYGSPALLQLEQALQQALHEMHPRARVLVIAADRSGQRAAEEAISTAKAAMPKVGGLFALQLESIRAAVAQHDYGAPGQPRLIGFDLEAALQQKLEDGVLDSLIVEDRFRMGEMAVQILASIRRNEHPARFRLVPPLLLTRESLVALKPQPPFNGLDR